MQSANVRSLFKFHYCSGQFNVYEIKTVVSKIVHKTGIVARSRIRLMADCRIASSLQGIVHTGEISLFHRGRIGTSGMLCLAGGDGITYCADRHRNE